MYDSEYHMADCPYFNIYVKHDKSMTIRKARYHLPEGWCLTSTSLLEAGDMLPKPGRESPSFKYLDNVSGLSNQSKIRKY